MTAPEPPPAWRSLDTPWLADMKAQFLDPNLRELGLDPAHYELVYELDGPPLLPPPPPLTDQQELARAAVLQSIAQTLDIPAEVLTIPPAHGENWRRHGPTAGMGDPYDVGAFERTRSRYMPSWRYVSGGKALHAFIDGSDRPACGIDPRRGPDRRPARWINSTEQGTRRYGGRHRGEHSPCARAVRTHRDAMLRGEI